MDKLNLECQGNSDFFKEFLTHFNLPDKTCWSLLSGSEM